MYLRQNFTFSEWCCHCNENNFKKFQCVQRHISVIGIEPIILNGGSWINQEFFFSLPFLPRKLKIDASISSSNSHSLSFLSWNKYFLISSTSRRLLSSTRDKALKAMVTSTTATLIADETYFRFAKSFRWKPKMAPSALYSSSSRFDGRRRGRRRHTARNTFIICFCHWKRWFHFIGSIIVAIWARQSLEINTMYCL